MTDDDRRRIDGRFEAIRQELSEREGREGELIKKLDALHTAVHESYAGAEGIGPRVVAIQAQMKGTISEFLTAISDFFGSFFDRGDSAKRPWVWLVLLAVFALAGLLWLARDTWINPEVRAERIEEARSKRSADSLRAARAHELERLRLEREIAGDRAQEAEARADTPTEARIDELDVDADNVTIEPPDR